MSSDGIGSPYKRPDEISGTVYIPCFKTIIDILSPIEPTDKNLGLVISAKLFLEFSAHHTSKRTKEVTSILTHRISSATRRIFVDLYKQYKNKEYLRAKEFITSSFTPPLFKSIVPVQESVFEKAQILTQICPNELKVIIVSNDEGIHSIRKKIENETGFDFTPENYPVVNTISWLQDELEKQNEVVMAHIYSCVVALGQIGFLEQLRKLK